jgi:hypothetical protein
LNGGIENKQNFYKIAKNKNKKIKRIRTGVEISTTKRINL